jgi:hypothetical protein
MKIVLFNFEQSGEVNKWLAVNDGVMGGLSQREVISLIRDQ